MSAVNGQKGMNAFKLNPEMHRAALNSGLSLSAFLEREDPSQEYKGDPLFEGTDAFERQLWRAGIRTRAVPTHGIWPSKVQDFFRRDVQDVGDVATLFPEYITRKYRQVAMQRAMGEQRFYMSSSPVSDVLKPDYLSTVVRQKQIAPPIPLDRVIAITTNVDSDVYKAFFLTDSEEGRVMHRTAEGTPLPESTLTGADHTVNLHKYGRVLKASYESIRRMNIDRFALHIALIAVQAEVDKVSEVIYVALNGDGNSGTSATAYNLSTMDGDATLGTPTVKSYLNWRMQWDPPYNCDVLIGQADDTLKFLMMDTGSANATFWQMFGVFGMGEPEFQNNPFSPPFTGWHSGVTADTWLGMDSRYSIEMVMEVGSDLVETNRIITTQFEEIAISEVVGFAVFDANGIKTLALDS